MNDTSSIGNELRDDVFALLSAAMKDSVTKEKNVSGKNSDVYYVERGPLPTQKTRIAVECKNYSKSLTRSDFSDVYETYNPVRVNFDHLVIVTRNGLAPGVQQTVDAHDWISHMTLIDFCHNLLRFGRYIEALKAQFNEGGLNNYYIPLNTTENDDLESSIVEWAGSESRQPVAILAGYGMGKTSFAKRIAYRFAENVDGSRSNRIPIYIKLEDIYAEQTMEGLICKHCTSQNNIEGFH